MAIEYVCQACGTTTHKWSGQCFDCHSWNTLIEQVVAKNAKHQAQLGYAGSSSAEVSILPDVPQSQWVRVSTDIAELDRVLGGGLVPGSVVLLGGDPGIGKSTLLLQVAAILNQSVQVLYVTGEESKSQVSMRAKRLGVDQEPLKLLAHTQVERILQTAQQENPQVLIIDSVQTLFCEHQSGAPGSVSQLRESAQMLVRYAKQKQVILFLVGHVTKDGTLAGPKVLEHMVDTVLYFEGDVSSCYRLIRATKNRFGAVNELGVFAMTDGGIKAVNNPSALFMTSATSPQTGSVITASWEGTRPLLIEVQALVDQSHTPNPRRVALGVDGSRLSMLLAILSRHGQLAINDQDVFVNVVGGMKIDETGIDLAVLVAVVSSFKDKVVEANTLVLGEVGLAGEIRPVQSGQQRILEAVKQGFTRVIAPTKNLPKQSPKGVDLVGCDHVTAALDAITYVVQS